MSTTRTWRLPTVIGVMLGTFLVQAAWIVAVPPFRGSDEFDHVYRADAVAHGDWGPVLVPPAEGRGGIVRVRESLVTEASAMCSSYEYTSDANCKPIEHHPDGRVSVATGAFGYHPAYYWLVGTPARLADGIPALLVMRLVSALLCTLMLGAAYWALGLAHPSPLPRLALLVGSTPVFLYTSAMVAPNGLEIASGAAAWSGFVALSLRGPALMQRSRVLLLTVVAAVVLVSLRQLGPLWVLLIVSMCLLLGGVSPWLRLARNHPVQIGVCVAAVGAATTGAYLWVSAAGSTSLPPVMEDYPAPVRTALSQPPLWLLQAIAAFPLRDDPAPMVVYAIYLLVGTTLLVLALRLGTVRSRVTLVVTLVLSLAVPLALTLVTIEALGKTWQGRYGLPFSIGIFIVAGLAMTGRGGGNRPTASPWLPILAMTVAVAHASSVVGLYVKELRNEVALGGGLWPYSPWWLVGLVSVAGVLICFLHLSTDQHRDGPGGDNLKARSTDGDPGRGLLTRRGVGWSPRTVDPGLDHAPGRVAKER